MRLRPLRVCHLWSSSTIERPGRFSKAENIINQAQANPPSSHPYPFSPSPIFALPNPRLCTQPSPLLSLSLSLSLSLFLSISYSRSSFFCAAFDSLWPRQAAVSAWNVAAPSSTHIPRKSNGNNRASDVHFTPSLQYPPWRSQARRSRRRASPLLPRQAL